MNICISSSDCLYVACIMDSIVRNTSFEFQVFRNVTLSLDECARHFEVIPTWCSHDSSVGIATLYVLDGPGIVSRWGARFSALIQTDPGAHSVSYTMGIGSFPGVKRLERGVDHLPYLAPRLKKE